MRRRMLSRIFADDDFMGKAYDADMYVRPSGPVMLTEIVKQYYDTRREIKEKSDYSLGWVRVAVDMVLLSLFAVIYIAGRHFPDINLSRELRKYKFNINQKIHFRKLISKPSLGLSPPFSFDTGI